MGFEKKGRGRVGEGVDDGLGEANSAHFSPVADSTGIGIQK